MGGIYTITCIISGKIYVGSAKNFAERWLAHQQMLINQKHFNINLQRAWNKYGSSAFHFSIIEELGEYDRTKFFENENFYIDTLRQRGLVLFNIARAEGGWGPETHLRKHEIAQKIRDTLKKRTSSMTEEQRKTVYGKGRRGKPLTDEHKKKTGDGLRGKSKSVETRQRMSVAQKTEQPGRRERMAGLGKQRIGKMPTNAITISVNGTEYPSGKATQRALNITARQLQKMVDNGTATRKEKTT